MNKEETLQTLKGLVLDVSKNDTAKVHTEEWKNKQNEVAKSLEQLTETEKIELEIEYQKWFRENILSKIPEELRKAIEEDNL